MSRLPFYSPFLIPTLFSALVLGSSGCRNENGTGSLDIELSINPDVATLVEVTWQTSDPGVSWVEYGTTEGSYEYSTPTTQEESTEHFFTLYGIPPLTDVYLEAFTQTADATLSATGEISTNNVPSTLPDMDVTVYDADLAYDCPYIIGVIQGEKNLVFAMNREGEWLWYHDLGATTASFDLQFDVDGSGVIYNYFDWPVSFGGAWLGRESLDRSEFQEIDTEGAHHAFAQLPDGTLAVIKAEGGEWFNEETQEPEPTIGDGIYELSPDGVWTNIFSVWDWIEPEPNAYWDLDFYGAGHDWTHGNALYYYSDTDTYLMSMGHLDMVVEIQRSTGEVLRTFGGAGEYSVVDGAPAFYFQHDAHWLDNGNLIMTSHYNEEGDFMAAEYEVDDTAKTLTEVWSYGQDQFIYSLAMGQAIRLDNGSTLVNFGYAGLLREVTTDDQIAWEATGDVGAWYGSIRYLQDFYELE